MTREPGGRRNPMREQLAYLAARIMAEDGTGDFALAKRKAARQAGVPGTRHLPTNDEVEQALRSYQTLYHEDAHRSCLRFLRTEALHAMRTFSRFNPHLVGSVLSGSAGRCSDINLHLFTDDVKGLELYLLDRQMEYRQAHTRLYVGNRPRILPYFVLTGREVVVTLTVLPFDDARCSVRRSPDGQPVERARVESVLSLVECDAATSSEMRP